MSDRGTPASYTPGRTIRDIPSDFHGIPSCCRHARTNVSMADNDLRRTARAAARNDSPRNLAAVHKAKDSLETAKALLTEHLTSCTEPGGGQ